MFNHPPMPWRDMALPVGGGGTSQAIRSELTQWPVQLHLVPADAPFFKGRELVVLSTCSPVASADMHRRFIRGRGVVVACPKPGAISRQVGRDFIGELHTGGRRGAWPFHVAAA